MLNVDALTTLKCWLFISQALKYKAELYGIDCVDIESVDTNSLKTFNYISIIESGCDLDSEIICEINDYTKFVKTRSQVYKNYINNPCTSTVEILCNIQYLPISLGWPITCTNGPFAFLI